MTETELRELERRARVLILPTADQLRLIDEIRKLQQQVERLTDQNRRQNEQLAAADHAPQAGAA